MRKIPFAGIELTSQRVRELRGTSELPGRPAVLYGHTYSKSTDQPGIEVVNPARGQLNRENECFPLRGVAPENLVCISSENG